MDIFITLIVSFLVLFFLYRKFKNIESIKLKVIYIILLVIHYISFALNYYLNNTLQNDSYKFFTNSLNANKITDLNFTGSQFMSVLVYPLVKLGFSFFSISLLFSTLSLYGFYKYINYLTEKYKNQKSKQQNLLLILFLMPSLHYWTAGLTKESIVFYCMSVIFFQTLKNKIVSFSFIVSLTLVLLIRPYLFAIILASYFIFVLLNGSMQKRDRLILITLSLLSALLGLPILKRFLKIDNLTLENLQKNFQSIVVYSQNNGFSSIDLENSTYLERFFLVLFRPLFYDASSVYQYLVSIENVINLFVISIFIYLIIIRNKFIFIFKENVFLSLTIMFLVLFFSIYLYNLGLASRMRSMFLPYIYVLIITFFTKYKTTNEA